MASSQGLPVVTPRPGLAELVDCLDCMVFRCRNDPALTVEYASAGALTLTGHSPAQLGVAGGTSYQGLLLDAPVDRLAIAQSSDAGHGDHYRLDYRLQRADGEIRCVKERGWLVRDAAGAVTHFEGFAEDITEQRQQRESAIREAMADALTGLLNRRAVEIAWCTALLNAECSRGNVAVAFLDLDDFKGVNDSLGHEAGDRLLQVTAQRISASVRHGDVVARLGGDEFVLLMCGFHSREELTLVLQRVRAAVAVPWQSGRHRLQVSCSMGVATFPADGRTVDQLLRNADAAMYEAKQTGRNRVHFFTAELNRAIVTRVTIEQRLRNALSRDQLQLHYQPRVDAATGRIVAAEALLRWQLPRQGLIMPGRFISVAEETGLIVPIGEWVLHSACRQAMAWEVEGLPPVIISVNVSPRQIREGNIVASIAAALRDSGLPPRLLQIELTESMAMQGAEGVIAMLGEIRALGVQIAIDDFGTGYSSLSYLKRFPIDQLKVDRSFVADLPEKREDKAIVRAIVTLGHELGLRVVAEGVETAPQAEFLRASGCDELQGYFFGRPIAAGEFIHLLVPRELDALGEALQA
jgi:diguanylate cyclase (GGDEF)-like protein/PAS domain S-box-containing protein